MFCSPLLVSVTDSISINATASSYCPKQNNHRKNPSAIFKPWSQPAGPSTRDVTPELLYIHLLHLLHQQRRFLLRCRVSIVDRGKRCLFLFWSLPFCCNSTSIFPGRIQTGGKSNSVVKVTFTETDLYVDGVVFSCRCTVTSVFTTEWWVNAKQSCLIQV